MPATKKALEPIDSSVVTVIGILMTGKTVQRFGENPLAATEDTKPTPPDK